MTRVVLPCFIALITISVSLAQDTVFTNSVNNMFLNERQLSLRGYAQIDYNQPMMREQRNNGNLEVHRLVLFVGYRFDEKLQFISEIELEHGDQIFIEQAFAQYRISPSINLRAGMVVIPMGIINEYHEPTTFHGVERPRVDGIIIPSTWRELAIGLTGQLPSVPMRYQVYLTNGFLSHDGQAGLLRGSDGLRHGRQKGLRSSISSPNFSAKLDYFGVRNLKLGLSTYLGRTQSELYDGLQASDNIGRARADSSVVGMLMIGADARYDYQGLELRAVYVHTNFKNSRSYNQFAQQDLGSAMTGYYIEAAYDVFQLSQRSFKTALLPFIRYERYNTHAQVVGVEKNKTFQNREITVGLSWRHGTAVSFKSDFQWRRDETNAIWRQLNIGVGVWF